MYGYSSELYHHGVKGMRWGVRNYQNADGTLTAEGRQRYGGAYGKKATSIGYLKDRQRIYRRVTADTMRQHLKEGIHINKNYRPFKGERLIKSTDRGQKALNEANKNLNAKYDAKFGKGTSQKLAKRAIGMKVGTALAASAITAISAVAVANTIHQQRTGKSATNNAIKSIDLSFVGNHFDRQTIKNIWGPDAHDMSSYFKEMSKGNTIALMRPKKGYMVK